MTTLLHMPWPFLHEMLSASLDVLVKATVLILLAMLLSALLRGQKRVLVRSAIWNALLVGLLVLPVATLWFPRLRVACLPPLQDAPAAATGHGIRPVGDPGGGNYASPSDLTDDTAAEVAADEFLPFADLTRSAQGLFYGLACLLAAYCVGSALLIVRLLASLKTVQQLRQTGRPLTDLAWRQRLNHWRERLGITREVNLAVSPTINVPMVFGWKRPAVLIPEPLAASLDAKQRDAVLLHELAHVQRRDYQWQILLRLVQATYWIHPLVWAIGRWVSASREQACDDLCTYHAATPQDYRTTLIEIAARMVRRPGVGLGIAMASTSRISKRLERIDGGHRAAHCLAGRPARVLTAVLALALTAAIGPLQLARRAAGAENDLAASTSVQSSTRPAKHAVRPAIPGEGRAVSKEEKIRLLRAQIDQMEDQMKRQQGRAVSKEEKIRLLGAQIDQMEDQIRRQPEMSVLATQDTNEMTTEQKARLSQEIQRLSQEIQRLQADSEKLRAFTGELRQLILETEKEANASVPATRPAVAATAATAPSGSAPRFRCEQLVYQFPETWAGDIVEHTWIVHNDGDAVLEILEAKPSCGCTVAEFDKQIQPGGQGRIAAKLTTHSSGYPQDLTKTINVRTNDPGSAQVVLTLKGKVKPRISIDPPSGAQFGTLGPDIPLTRTVRLTNNTDKPLKIERGALPPSSPFAYEIKEIEPGKVYELTVTANKALLKEGSNNFPIPLKTSFSEQPDISAPASLSKAPLIQATPPTLAVATPVASPLHREVLLTYNGPGAMNITGASVSDPAVKVKAELIPPGAGPAARPTWKVMLDIPQGWNPPKPQAGPHPQTQPAIETVIRTDVKERPEVKIGIHTYPQPPTRTASSK